MIASLIFLATFDYLSGIVPKNHNNQSHLAPEEKVKSRPGGPLKADDSIQIPGSPSKKKEDDIFIGLFTQQEMEQYFKHKKSNYENLKALVEAWCGDVCKLVDIEWEDFENQRRENFKEIKKKERASAVEAQKKFEVWDKERKIEESKEKK